MFLIFYVWIMFQFLRGVNLSEVNGISEWTDWQNTDTPDDGGGDRESSYHSCPSNAKPIAAECRVVGSSEIFSRETQILAPDILYKGCTTSGLVCRNHDQPVFTKCHDYEIRFLCLKTNADKSIFEIWIILVVAISCITVPLGLVLFFQCRATFRTKPVHSPSHGTRSLSMNVSQSETAIIQEMNQSPPSYESLYGDTVHPVVMVPISVRGNTNGAISAQQGNTNGTISISAQQSNTNGTIQSENQCSQDNNSSIAVTAASGNIYHNNLHRQLQMQSVNPESIPRNTLLTIASEINYIPQCSFTSRPNSQIQTAPPTYQEVLNLNRFLPEK